LREAGADDRTIADILGQKSVSMRGTIRRNAALPADAGALVLGLDHTQARNRLYLECIVRLFDAPNARLRKRAHISFAAALFDIFIFCDRYLFTQ
jgi:hypothetical protein